MDDPSEARKLGVCFPTYADMLEDRTLQAIVVGDTFVRLEFEDAPDATFSAYGKKGATLWIKVKLQNEFGI